MAKLVAAKCPSCAATLNVDPGASQLTCEYCGQTSLVTRSKKAAAKTPGPVIVVRERGGTSWVVPVMLVVVVGSIAAGVVIAGADLTAPSGTTTVGDNTRAGIIAREHDLKNPPARSKHELHDECICRTDLDGDGTNETTAQVATRVYFLPDGEYLTTYWVDITGQDPWYLPVDEGTAPPVSVHEAWVRLYLVCKGPVLMLAAGGRATGWDLVEHRRLWTTPLGGAYESGMAIDPPGPDQFTHQCTRLNGNPDTAEINTVHGPVRVRMADGVVEP
jgi:predicted RNA-binding Zn-ribbon protein involved in translation (DUF1610 family)